MFETAAVTDFQNMFSGCVTLQTVPIYDLLSATVTPLTNMFRECDSLTVGRLSNVSISINYEDTILDATEMDNVVLGLVDAIVQRTLTGPSGVPITNPLPLNWTYVNP